MSGLSRGAPDKVKIKVRGDGSPLATTQSEVDHQEEERAKAEAARSAAGRASNS